MKSKLEKPWPLCLRNNTARLLTYPYRTAYRLVTRRRLVRSVLTLAFGAAGAQAINIACSPLIARLYGPEALGILGTFNALIPLVLPAASLAYPMAIVLPKDDADAVKIVQLSSLLSVALALTAGVGFFLVHARVASVLGISSVSHYIPAVALSVLFATWSEIARQWLIRKKSFKPIANCALLQSLLVNFCKVGFGWWHPLASLLLVFSTLGHALHAALLFQGAKRQVGWGQNEGVLANNLRSIGVKNVAKKYSDFPLYRAPQNLINAASRSMPFLLLGIFYGPSTVGFYTLARMLTAVPSNLLGQAVKDVLYPQIADKANRNIPVYWDLVYTTTILLIVGVIPFGIIALFGESIFVFIFGPDWNVAGAYARWLALFFLFNFINKPCVAAVPVLGMQRGLLIYEVLSTGGKAAALVVGFQWLRSAEWSVALFSLVGVTAYSGMILWIMMSARRPKGNATAGE